MHCKLPRTVCSAMRLVAALHAPRERSRTVRAATRLATPSRAYSEQPRKLCSATMGLPREQLSARSRGNYRQKGHHADFCDQGRRSRVRTALRHTGDRSQMRYIEGTRNYRLDQEERDRKLPGGLQYLPGAARTTDGFAETKRAPRQRRAARASRCA